MPITDIAASFLFREGLDHLPADAVSVIDFPDNPQDRQRKLDQLLRSYRSIVPQLREDRFEFCGAVEWIRDQLTNWLYDSNGNPIAFESLGWFVSWNGECIGSRARMTEVWHGGYRGEIVAGNRLLQRLSPPAECPGGDVDPPPLPSPGTLPPRIDAIALPDGYRDLEEVEIGGSP